MSKEPEPMKKRILAAFFTALISTVLPFFVPSRSPSPPEPGKLWYEPPKRISAADCEIRLTLLDGDKVTELTMEDYLFGAVSAEMPASFDLEALKAQAVALRTYALYKLRVSPSDKHSADLCASSSCCAAWKSDDYLKEKWGADYPYYSAVIRSAVRATDGEYLVYGGEPVLAAFHASSNGATESSEAVWGRALPYLVSVPTPENAETVRSFEDRRVYSRSELSELIPGCDPDAELYSGEKLTDSGRLASVKILGVELTGRELRTLLGLGSTSAQLSEENGDLVVLTRGRGHGVGMSQFGADAMAKSGMDYREILAAYYPGTELVGQE